MNKGKLLKIGNEKVYLVHAKYENGKTTAILLDTKDGESYACVSVNLIPLPENYIALDVNNCSSAIVDALRKIGLFKDENAEINGFHYISSGFVQYPIVELDMDVLNDYAITLEYEED